MRRREAVKTFKELGLPVDDQLFKQGSTRLHALAARASCTLADVVKAFRYV